MSGRIDLIFGLLVVARSGENYILDNPIELGIYGKLRASGVDIQNLGWVRATGRELWVLKGARTT